MEAFQPEFLDRAVALSAKALDNAPGGPFGAVVVLNGDVVGEGWNEVTSTNDPTAHAEMQAIRKACSQLRAFSLKGAVLYSSCEPCPMCLAAIYWARIDSVYYANSRMDAAAIGFDDALIYQEMPKHPTSRMVPCVHHPNVEALRIFKAWQELSDKMIY